MTEPEADESAWRHRVAVLTSYAAVGTVGIAILWYARFFVFLLFGGLLLALGLESLATAVTRRTRLSQRSALLFILAAGTGLL